MAVAEIRGMARPMLKAGLIFLATCATFFARSAAAFEDDPVPALVRELGSADLAARRQAFARLVALGGDEPARVLTALSESPADPEVARACAELRVAVPRERARRLCERARCGVADGALGRAIDALVETPCPGAIFMAAFAAGGAREKEEARRAIAPFLDDSVPDMREAASRALDFLSVEAVGASGVDGTRPAPPEKGEILTVEETAKGGQSHACLVSLDPDGTARRTLFEFPKGLGTPNFLRQTARGTILLGRCAKDKNNAWVGELDLARGLLWKIAPRDVRLDGDDGVDGIWSVDLLPDGTLVMGVSTNEDEWGQRGQEWNRIRMEMARIRDEGGTVEEKKDVERRLREYDKKRGEDRTLFLKVDLRGKVLDLLSLPKVDATVRVVCAAPAGEGHFLVAGETGIREIDWDGSTRRRWPWAAEGRWNNFRGVEPLPGGGVLLTVRSGQKWDVTRAESKLEGRVVELDPAGKVVWEAGHKVPVTVQTLPAGRVLVEGG